MIVIEIILFLLSVCSIIYQTSPFVQVSLPLIALLFMTSHKG